MNEILKISDYIALGFVLFLLLSLSPSHDFSLSLSISLCGPILFRLRDYASNCSSISPTYTRLSIVAHEHTICGVYICEGKGRRRRAEGGGEGKEGKEREKENRTHIEGAISDELSRLFRLIAIKRIPNHYRRRYLTVPVLASGESHPYLVKGINLRGESHGKLEPPSAGYRFIQFRLGSIRALQTRDTRQETRERNKGTR